MRGVQLEVVMLKHVRAASPVDLHTNSRTRKQSDDFSVSFTLILSLSDADFWSCW